MIAEGSFPFRQDEDEFEDAPRVGDGVILLDPDLRVRFASPNAVSSMHRLGIHSYTSGLHLAEMGFDQDAVDVAIRARLPVTEEIERGETSLLLQAIPQLSDDKVVGVCVLLRDVVRPAPARPPAALQGRDHPRDPPPGEEQPADDRRAAAAAGSTVAVTRGAGGDRGVGATDPLDRHRARDALARAGRRGPVRRHRAAARAGGRRDRHRPRPRPAPRGRGRRRHAARRSRHAARRRAQRADAERGRPRVPGGRRPHHRQDHRAAGALRRSAARRRGRRRRGPPARVHRRAVERARPVDRAHAGHQRARAAPSSCAATPARASTSPSR